MDARIPARKSRKALWATVVTLAVLVAGSVFFLAPIIYSPSHVEECGGPISPSGEVPGCGSLPVPAYESPSCLLFHVGVTHEESITSSSWSYAIGCAPDRTVHWYLY